MDKSFLLDHRVRGTSILPGAWYLSEALEHGAHVSVVEFLSMEVVDAARPATDYTTLSEGEGLALVGAQDGNVVARGRVNADSGSVPDALSLPVVDSSVELVDRASIYSTLAQHSNDYGSAFQGLDRLQVAEGVAVARFSAPEALDSDRARLTVLLDNCTHIAASLGGLRTTYLLSSIESVTRHRPTIGSALAADLIVRCTLRGSASTRTVADVSVLEADGSPILSIRGLTLTTFAGAEAGHAEPIALAATFTLDPFEQMGEFWGRSLDIPLTFKLADYDQLNQTLVSGSGAFDGSAARHVALVRVGDFDRRERMANLPDSSDDQLAAKAWPSDLPIHALPNGREVAGLNEYETQYLYQEIFRDLAYRRYDVRMLDGDTVIDIGANIGFFSLFAASEAKNIRSIAIEPSPAVIPMLRANLERYSPGSVVIEAGASSAEGTARFSAYRNSSVFSSFDADGSADAEAISQVIRNTLETISDLDEVATERAVEELMAGRLDVEEYDCRLVAVSDVIDEYKLETIGLLKIDAEKSEDAIIAGIREEHWARIEQVVIEVHLQGGRSDAHIVDMLEGHGFVVTRDEEALLSDSGLITLYAARPERIARNLAAAGADTLDRVADGLVEAVKVHAGRTSTPLDVVFCPSDIRDPALVARHAEVEHQLIQQFDSVNGVTSRTWADLTKEYPVVSLFDASSDASAHIPFNDEWYAATGTALVREHLLRTRPPIKVIVVDGDNTLWGGVVGEAGVEGIVIEEKHRLLHAWLKSRRATGALVCIASKNVEVDVRDAIEKRDDIDLAWSDFTATRVNWLPKPENLRSLSDELSLGLDAFVFVDDSSVECAEMRALLPEVVTVVAHPDRVDLPAVLDALWPLEPQVITEADKQRADRYREEQQRQGARSSEVSLASFIASLEIEVEIEPVSDETLPRASQMTLRTNQFNLTTVRRDVDKLSDVLNQGKTAEVISVRDKFGDYGITGLVIHSIEDSALQVDTFLLSCRVLGRAVEHAVLRHLGACAQSAGVESVRLPFKATSRNAPAEQFLRALDASCQVEGEMEAFVIASQFAAKAEFEELETLAIEASTEQRSGPQASPPWPSSALLQSIAEELTSAQAIAAAASVRSRVPRPELPVSYRAASGAVETELVAIWEEALGVDGIGAEDNFFELGGSSLRAVQMIATLEARHGHTVSVIELFERPTIAHLAARIQQPAESAESSGEGRQRGAGRREKQQARRRVRR